MRRALAAAVAVSCAACEGEVLGGRGMPSSPVDSLPPALVEPAPAWAETLDKPVADAAAQFSTVSWDLEAEAPAAGVPVVASLDVRALPNGEVELLNPRFALKPAAAHQHAFSSLRVAVGAFESAAFENARVVAASTRAAVLAPGLIAVAKGAAPLHVRLRFVAAETALAPEPATQDPAMPAEPVQPPALVDGQTYVLHTKCADGSGVIAVEGAVTDDGALAVLATAQAGRAEQRFTITAQAPGGVMLVAQHSGRALNVPRGSLLEGTQLIQWNAADFAQPNQRWMPEREADGSYRFRGVQSGLYVDAVGTAVVQAAPGGSCGQRFVLEQVE